MRLAVGYIGKELLTGGCAVDGGGDVDELRQSSRLKLTKETGEEGQILAQRGGRKSEKRKDGGVASHGW